MSGFSKIVNKIIVSYYDVYQRENGSPSDPPLHCLDQLRHLKQFEVEVVKVHQCKARDLRRKVAVDRGTATTEKDELFVTDAIQNAADAVVQTNEGGIL